MANVLEILIKAIDQASGVLDKIGQSGEAAAKKVEIPWKAVGAAVGAAGVSMELLARSQEQLSVATRQLANDVGLTVDQVRELAISVADASTPLEDVLALMDLAQKGGVTSAQGLKEYAEFWAMVGKATGENSVQLAEAAVGLRALGIEATNVKDAEAALAYITDQTTISAGEFLNFVSRLAPELATAGLTIDDVAKYMAVLEDRGITGKKTVSEFGKAFDQSKGDVTELNKALGISKTDLEKYTKSIKDNATAMREDAAIVDQAKTPFQNLQTMVGELTYKYGDLIGKAAGFAPVLMAVGPGITIFDTLKGAVQGAGGVMPLLTGGLAGVVPAAGAALAALAPFLPIILAIVAAVAVLYLAWTNNWGGIQEKTAAAIDFIGGRMDSMKGAFDKLGEGLVKIGGKLFEVIDKLAVKLTGNHAIENFGKAVKLLGTIWDATWNVIGIVFDKWIDVIIGGIDWLTEQIGKLIDFFSTLADNPIVKWLREQLGPAIEWVDDKVDTFTTGLEKFNKALEETEGKTGELKGPIDDLTDSLNSGKGSVEEYTKQLIAAGFSEGEAARLATELAGGIQGTGTAADQATSQLATYIASLETTAEKVNALNIAANNANYTTQAQAQEQVQGAGYSQQQLQSEVERVQGLFDEAVAVAEGLMASPNATEAQIEQANAAAFNLGKQLNALKAQLESIGGGAAPGGGEQPPPGDGGFGVNDTPTGSNYTYGIYGPDPNNPNGPQIRIGTGTVTGADPETGQGGTETIKYFDWYLRAMEDQADAARETTEATEQQGDAAEQAAGQISRAALTIEQSGEDQVKSTEETAGSVVRTVAGMNRDVAANYQGAGESMAGMAGEVQNRIGTMAITTSEQAAAACDLIVRKFQEVNQAAQGAAAGGGGAGGSPGGGGGGMCNWGGSGGGGLSGGNFPTDPMGASLISSSFRTSTYVNATMFRSRAAQQVQGIAPCLGDGGTVQQAGIAVVGEGGPEIVSLPRSATVQPLRGGGGSGGVRDVHIHGVVVADQEGLRKLARMLNNIMIAEGIRKGAST